MKTVQETRTNPLRAKWPAIFFVLVVTVLTLAIISENWLSSESMEIVRLALGFVGAGIILFLSTFRIRRLVYTKKIGSMDGWRQAHLYLGLLCAFIILIHSEFRVTGPFGIIMAVLFIFSVATGILGSVLYRVVPVWLSKHGVDALEMDKRRKDPSEYIKDAEAIIENSSKEFVEYFNNQVRPRFVYSPSALSYLLRDETDITNARKKIFDQLKLDAPKLEKQTVVILENLYSERDAMEYKWARLQTLRWWILIHAPATAALLATIVFHIASVFYY